MNIIGQMTCSNCGNVTSTACTCRVCGFNHCCSPAPDNRLAKNEQLDVIQEVERAAIEYNGESLKQVADKYWNDYYNDLSEQDWKIIKDIMEKALEAAKKGQYEFAYQLYGPYDFDEKKVAKWIHDRGLTIKSTGSRAIRVSINK